MDWVHSHCVNCNLSFAEGLEPVGQISISLYNDSDSEEDKIESEISEQRKNITIIEALSAVFISSPLKILKESEGNNENSEVRMCFRCAETLSHLYQAYIELLSFSDPAARICKLIRQIEAWHNRGKELFLNPDNVEIKEEDTDPSSEPEGDYVSDFVPYVEIGEESTKVEVNSDWEQDTEVDDDYEYEPEQDPLLLEDEDYSVKRRSSRLAVSRAMLSAVNAAQTSKNNPSTTVKTKNCKSKPEVAGNHNELKLTKKEKSSIPEFDEDGFPLLERKKKVNRCRFRKLIPCSYSNCKRSYFFQWRIQQHILEDHDQKKPCKCRSCGFKYFDTKTRESHHCLSKFDRKNRNLGFRCEYCGDAFTNLMRFRMHCATHDHQELVKCPVVGCNRRYRVPAHMEKHNQVVHAEGVPVPVKKTPFQCQECGKIIASSTALSRHMKIHKGELKYVCSICGKRYNQSNGLSSHMYTHSTDRKYQCILCKVGFVKPYHLTNHYKSNVHADQPEKIAELLKQKIRPNATGEVVIPQKYKFKNHGGWAKNSRKRKAVVAEVEATITPLVPISNTSTSSHNSDCDNQAPTVQPEQPFLQAYTCGETSIIPPINYNPPPPWYAQPHSNYN